MTNKITMGEALAGAIGIENPTCAKCGAHHTSGICVAAAKVAAICMKLDITRFDFGTFRRGFKPLVLLTGGARAMGAVQ